MNMKTRSREAGVYLSVPNEALVGLGRDFADLYSQYLESPPAFWYFAYPTYFGACMDRIITIDSALDISPRLYSVLLGESANDRKSTSLDKTHKFYVSLYPNTLSGEVPPIPRVLMGIGSAEGLADDLNEHTHAVLLNLDEFRAFVDKASIQNSVLLPMTATLFERRDYDNLTKRGTLSVRNASLSILAASTVETYAGMFNRHFQDIGFLNRLWLVVDRPTRKIAVPEPIPEQPLTVLRERTRQRIDLLIKVWQENNRQPLVYRLTPKARTLFEAWYSQRESSIFTRRLDTYGHRLMLVLAATAQIHSFEIGEDIIEAVLRLLHYQLAARRECDPIDAENTVAKMEERIRRTLNGRVLTSRDLMKKVNANRTGLWVWNTARKNLIDAREMKHDPQRNNWKQHLRRGHFPPQQRYP